MFRQHKFIKETPNPQLNIFSSSLTSDYFDPALLIDSMHPQETSNSSLEESPVDPQQSAMQNKQPETEKDSMLSAINSGNPIEKLKGRIIATNKLLKILENLKEEKNRTAALQDQLKQLETSNLHINQTLTNREMYIKQLEAAAEDQSKKQQSNSAEVTKLKKEVASLKSTKESVQTSHRSLQTEHITLKKEYNELKKERDELENKYDALEDDKMELNINYEMLQGSLNDSKQEVSKMQAEKAELQELHNKVSQLEAELKERDRAPPPPSPQPQPRPQPQSESQPRPLPQSRPQPQSHPHLVRELKKRALEVQKLSEEKVSKL
ncbi:hypothetical protein BDB00DRAFT_370746 [Zychaea mexicana]|uniref:uncharacterized protein n=1 Tax=Zychaea mexicana TaxID=64656 RepID=UPI0022FDDA15|nr:uncharacterized protein BDB00DRAFT_370746 [Zychaea mexicana]KAI9493405.1 hypothetical protein BDB00DRAFT_370746 [Zychaea mexicana]